MPKQKNPGPVAPASGVSNPNDPNHELVDGHAMAQHIGLSYKVVMRYARAGAIPSVKIGQRVRRFHVPTVIAQLHQTERQMNGRGR